MTARELEIRLAHETVVAHFEHVAQRRAVQLARQQIQERGEVVALETLSLCELPVDRTQAVAELGETAEHEILDRLAGAGQFRSLRGVARRLQRKHETRRRLLAPGRVDRRLLRAVVGAIDLDRGQLATGVFELAPLHEPRGIEVLAPEHVRPAAGAGADVRVRA